MRIHIFLRALISQPRRSLFVSSAALLTAFSPAMSQAGPLVIEETSKFTLVSPEPPFELSQPRIDGDTLLVQGSHHPADQPFDTRHAAFVFERDSSGAWVFVSKLADLIIDEVDQREVRTALSDGVAAFTTWGLDVFERTATGWVEAPFSTGGHIGGQAGDVEMSPGMILVGDIVFAGVECSEGGNLVEKQAGTWVITHVFPGFPRECPQDIEDVGNSSVDISSDRVILSGPSQVHIFNRNADGSWPNTATSIIPLGAHEVVIHGDDALTSAPSVALGPHVLRGNGSWSVAGNLHRPDARNAGAARSFDLESGIAAVGYAADPHRGEGAGSIAVFQRNASGEFDYVAKLLASDATPGAFLGGVQVSGRTIYGHSEQGTYVFELPTDFSQPALVQDDFQDRNAAEWAHIAGSNVSVVSNGSSFVYRQSSLAGDAGSVRTGVDMRNQGIEADVVPRSFATGSGNRWFGLTVRETDPNNSYYVTMRKGNVVSLRKLENGAITVLASAPTPVTLNRRYKLRLEAVGTWIRAYVDGRLLVEAQDRTHTQGAPGMRMFRTATDYDNVVMSPNALVTLFRDAFDSIYSPENWVSQSGDWTRTGTETQGVFVQSSLAGDALTTTDVNAQDQVVQVRARATRYASGGSRAQRWFGVLARMRDARNYYYVTVRNDNTISLRKLVNGQAVVLDTAPLTVSLGSWYTLRLEAIGSTLRTYVNGRLRLEANDSTYGEGSHGLATFRTSAQFDNFIATQP